MGKKFPVVYAFMEPEVTSCVALEKYFPSQGTQGFGTCACEGECLFNLMPAGEMRSNQHFLN